MWLATGCEGKEPRFFLTPQKPAKVLCKSQGTSAFLLAGLGLTGINPQILLSVRALSLLWLFTLHGRTIKIYVSFINHLKLVFLNRNPTSTSYIQLVFKFYLLKNSKKCFPPESFTYILKATCSGPWAFTFLLHISHKFIPRETCREYEAISQKASACCLFLITR